MGLEVVVRETKVLSSFHGIKEHILIELTCIPQDSLWTQKHVPKT